MHGSVECRIKSRPKYFLYVIKRVLFSSHLKGYCSVHTDEKSHDITDAAAIAFHTAVSCGKCVLKVQGG